MRIYFTSQGKDGKAPKIINTPSTKNGKAIFYKWANLESFEGYSLKDATDCDTMFSNCSKLTSFSSDLSKLQNGSGMFYGCKLDGNAVENILTTLPNVQDSGYNLTLTMNDEGCAKVSVILGNFSDVDVIPYYIDGSLTKEYKGWQLHLSYCYEGGWVFHGTKYDIVEGSSYIPDANEWNNDIKYDSTYKDSIMGITHGNNGYGWKE